MADTLLVASIDFGTTFSGWGYMLSHEFETESTIGNIRHWNSGSSITEKAPTVVLIKPNGNELEAFGYEAEDRYQELYANNEHENYYFFQRFKMKLHKQFGEAGIDADKLSIALEPEAASIYYRYSPIQRRRESTGTFVDRFEEGTKYMVLDAGGGTIDVTVHEVLHDGKVKEIKAASGGGWGGCLVNKEFSKVIIDIVGNNVYRVFKEENMGDFLDFFRTFELKKRAITPDKETNVLMSVPFTLWNMLEEENKQSFTEAIKSSPYADNIKALPKKHKLEFKATFFRNLFTNSLKNIVQHTESILKDPDIGKINAILMVGGFSESPMLQKSIKTSFHDIEVIIPKEASSSILRGALIFGFSPNLISERVLRLTYGVSCLTKFIEGEHPDSRRVMTDIGPQCRNKFDKHVERYKVVKVGEPQITKMYTPINRDQRSINLPIYGSKMKDPKYTDEDCIFIGNMDMELSDHDGDLSREVKVCFTFSGTEIVVSAHDLKTGKSKKGPLDYPVNH